MSIPRFTNKSMRVRLIVSSVALLSLLFLIVAALPTGSGAQPQNQPASRSLLKKKESSRFVPGEVLVRYKSEAIAANKTGTTRITGPNGRLVSMRVEDLKVSQLVAGLRLAYVDPDSTLDSIEALRSQPDVLYAEPNYILRAAVTPNDTRFGSLHNMIEIGGPAAWDIQQGSTDVVVAILDQGIDINHADLVGNIWTNPSPGSVPGFSGDLHGVNLINNNGNIFSGADTETHGTHVAGIVGARGNNNVGVTGVAWRVSLMSLRFLDAIGEGTTSDAIKGCNYAKTMRDQWIASPTHTQGANVRIVNASFSNADPSQAFLDSLTGLNNSGILFVAAAGNRDEDGTREPDNDRVPHFPSSFNTANVIAVGASDTIGNVSTFSHFGAGSVDLVAPGASILSTTPRCVTPGANTCQPTPPDIGANSTYSTFSGTSMAAPHVSGAAALLWSQNPNLTVPQVKNLLLVNGEIVPSLVDKTLTGRRLNVLNSLQSLIENDSTAPGAVTNAHINSQAGRTLEIGWTSSGDDGANGTASLYQITFVDGSNAIPLKGVIPIVSGKGQATSVTIPYRHTSGQLRIQSFDNAGNEGTPVNIPVTLPLSLADPYTTSVGAAAALSTGGTNLDPQDDDRYLDFLFPSNFSFPFLGNNVTSVTLSTNGNIYFGTPPEERDDGTADDLPPRATTLGGYQMVAGLWADLDISSVTRPSTSGIFVVQPNANQLIFRWQGEPCNYNNGCTGGPSVDFEIELNSNGVIRTRYGAGTLQQTVVGLGLGNQESYPIASHTSELTGISLNNAGQVTFTPRAETTSTVEFSSATGSVNEGTPSIAVGVTRAGDTSSVATVLYTTNDLAGPSTCDSGGIQASSRCDYLLTAGKLTFAAGETTKTINIPIIDDNFVEGPQSFFITLSSPVGVTLGTLDDAQLTINDGGVEGGSNPIDTPAFFVRQHYIDFLNREADSGGLNFWTNEITSCGSDPVCIDVKRVNVSAAFFLSIEFQQTGYLVYRAYKSAFGNLPVPPPPAPQTPPPVPVAFSEFIRDTQQIGQNVQVGVGNWEQTLESNKQKYLLEMVQRPAFKALYPNTMTAQQFVDQLNANAGNVLSPAEKTTLVSSFGPIPSDISRRAAALRTVTEDEQLVNGEFNKAFVLMQYFGYLRRSPNDLPDSDYSGFNFWLGKLDSFNGNFVNADMVKSFIVAGEYRNRFGQ